MPESKGARAALRDFLATGAPPRVMDVDVDALLAEASQQGLAGVLHAAWSAEGDWSGPARLRSALAERRRSLLVRGVRQLELAARAQPMLAEQGIPALPLKGAALAEQLYEGEGDRPMADVDLLATERWGDARDFLQLQGFSVLARADHAWAFLDPLSGSVLELHHSVTSCPGLFPLDGPGLVARSREGSGQVRRLPAPEDLLVHLAMHASFQHGLVLSLVQWLDFRRLLERLRPEFRNVVAIAGRLRASGVVAAALLAAEAVVGAALSLELRGWAESEVPSGLRSWLLARRAAPLAFVAPTVPELARVRWGLSSGRRIALVTSTLAPSVPGETAGLLARAARGVRRGLRLLPRLTSSWRS
jgi:Uncharacterised nucleotidyltransferase